MVIIMMIDNKIRKFFNLKEENLLYIIDTAGKRPHIAEWNKHNRIAENLILYSLQRELKPVYVMHDTTKEL